MTTDTILQSAVNTLRSGAGAPTALADALPTAPAFLAAVNLIQSLKEKGGRLIVTGVGKSGHIGGKIAATLASTGTPAFFVHPTEALHGDLGMITDRDAVLALSHSGESKELAAVLSYCKRFGIPLIALTGKPGSTLGKAATHILNTRVEKEACPINMAPTTSTTAALALADALAVGLMTARGFGKNDFAVFHPGGKLGAQMLRVSEVMLTQNLPILPATASMKDVLVELTGKNQGSVGFTAEDGALVGIFTDGDLKRRLMGPDGTDLFSRPATEVMTSNPKTITADVLAVTGVAQMQAQNVKDLWVVDAAGHPTGLFRLETCLARGVV